MITGEMTIKEAFQVVRNSRVFWRFLDKGRAVVVLRHLEGLGVTRVRDIQDFVLSMPVGSSHPGDAGLFALVQVHFLWKAGARYCRRLQKKRAQQIDPL